MFENKFEKESHQHREVLKDHAAHRHVLGEIARSREDPFSGARAESHLGHYGPGSSKLQIQPLIEKYLKVGRLAVLLLCPPLSLV
jgi:hypothetical protein